jgi:hypothetical protein
MTLSFLKPFGLLQPWSSQFILDNHNWNELMKQNQNLVFHPKRPCLEPEEHFGRQSLVHHAYGRLGTDDVQSFAIIGFHKEGKTSFVNYIRHPRIAEEYLDNANQYIFLYLDISKQHLPDEASFFKIFYQKIDEQLSISHLKDILDLNKITDWLIQKDRRLILVFDNFNLIVTNPNFKVSFYEGLRSWFSTHTQVGCIVTSPLALLALSIPHELAGSPFFNIFDSYSLSPLNLTEATGLLYDRLPEALREREQDIFELIAQVGYSPYLLQQAGQVWISNTDKQGKASFKQHIENVYQACLPYYQEIYASLKNRQLDDITRLLSVKQEGTLRIDHNLIDRGLIAKDKSGFSAKLMERFFRERLNIQEKKSLLSKFKKLIKK